MCGRGEPPGAHMGASGMDAREADTICAGAQRLLSDEGARRIGTRTQQRASAGNARANRRTLKSCTSNIISAMPQALSSSTDADRALVFTLDEQGGWTLRLDYARRGHSPTRSRIDFFPAFTGVDFFADHGLDRLHAPRGRTQDAMAGPRRRARVRVSVSGDVAPRAGKIAASRFAFFQRGSCRTYRFLTKFYRTVGVDPAIGKAAETGSPRPPIPDGFRKQLAASVQQACGTIAAELAERYRKQTGAKSLCLAGGLFLNPVVVSHVEETLASTECSFSLQREMKAPRSARHGTCGTKCKKNRATLPSKNSTGDPAILSQDIKQVLDNCKARYRFHMSDEHQMEETIQLLAAGKLSRWFHGAAEFGPRALGNRSLLASPWAAYVKENRMNL